MCLNAVTGTVMVADQLLPTGHMSLVADCGVLCCAERRMPVCC